MVELIQFLTRVSKKSNGVVKPSKIILDYVAREQGTHEHILVSDVFVDGRGELAVKYFVEGSTNTRTWHPNEGDFRVVKLARPTNSLRDNKRYVIHIDDPE